MPTQRTLFAEGAAYDAATSHDVGPLINGAELGSFQVLGPLDAGGMGEVYRALDTHPAVEVFVSCLC
jgi:hypothetical protein